MYKSRCKSDFEYHSTVYSLPQACLACVGFHTRYLFSPRDLARCAGVRRSRLIQAWRVASFAAASFCSCSRSSRCCPSASEVAHHASSYHRGPNRSVIRLCPPEGPTRISPVVALSRRSAGSIFFLFFAIDRILGREHWPRRLTVSDSLSS